MRKNVKRFMGVSCAIVLSVAMLAGCTSKDTSKEAGKEMDNTQEDTKDKDTKDITFYTVDCASELECHDYWDGMITDIELVGYAERVLFPYEPSVVFFQTGSNDYVQLSGTDEEKIITDNKLEGVRK